MIEKTMYVCEICGQTFDDEDEARIHEYTEKVNILSITKKARFFDEDGREVLFDARDIYYCELKDEETAEMVHNMLHEEEYASPFDEDGVIKPGCFYIDHNTCGWKDFADFETEYLKMKNIFN